MSLEQANSDAKRAPEPEPLAVPIPTAGRMIGVGRSTVYKLLTRGDLESIHVLDRNLVTVASIRRLVERGGA